MIVVSLLQLPVAALLITCHLHPQFSALKARRDIVRRAIRTRARKRRAPAEGGKVADRLADGVDS